MKGYKKPLTEMHCIGEACQWWWKCREPEKVNVGDIDPNPFQINPDADLDQSF
jgi:hypothetical protein